MEYQTGWAPAVVIANLYLDNFDQWVLTRSVGHVAWYRRFVDDTVYYTDLDNEKLMPLFCEWHPRIQWEGAGETRIMFLDLELAG